MEGAHSARLHLTISISSGSPREITFIQLRITVLSQMSQTTTFPIIFLEVAPGKRQRYNLTLLADAARSAPNANVQTWFVPGAEHGQSYNTAGKVYVDRLVTFYTAALGPDTSVS